MNTSTLSSSTVTCPHCGLLHEHTCHRIKAIEYWPNGEIKRVEFHDPTPPLQWVDLTPPIGPHIGDPAIRWPFETGSGQAGRHDY